MHKKVAAAVCAAVLVGVGVIAGGAFGGEVKGPPGTTANTDTTAGPSHANSACVFSGLNDNIQGQTTSQTQTPADGPPGAAGHGAGDEFPNGCRGGYNPDNQPPPGNSGQH
jgi:hypothetical protein